MRRTTACLLFLLLSFFFLILIRFVFASTYRALIEEPLDREIRTGREKLVVFG